MSNRSRNLNIGWWIAFAIIAIIMLPAIVFDFHIFEYFFSEYRNVITLSVLIPLSFIVGVPMIIMLYQAVKPSSAQMLEFEIKPGQRYSRSIWNIRNFFRRIIINGSATEVVEAVFVPGCWENPAEFATDHEREQWHKLWGRTYSIFGPRAHSKRLMWRYGKEEGTYEIADVFEKNKVQTFLSRVVKDEETGEEKTEHIIGVVKEGEGWTKAMFHPKQFLQFRNYPYMEQDPSRKKTMVIGIRS
jgi:hypothetical protein